MKTWELLKDFQLKMPKLVRDLEQATHHFDAESLSPHHLEGNVFGHTNMVLLMAEHYNENLNVRISALCHDLGKPMSITRVEDKKRVRMFNHESLSVYLALDYLNTLDLSSEDKIRICQLIALHTYLYKEMREDGYEQRVISKFAGEQELFYDILSLTRSDALGRFAENEDRSPFFDPHQTFSSILYGINPVIYPRETQGEAIVLIGPPMSGKSSWIKKNTSSHLILSRDEVIMEMGKGKSYSEAYKSVDQDKVNAEYDSRRKLAMRSGKDLVFDMCNMSEKDRRRNLNGLPKQMKRKAVVFLTGYNTLLERNEKRTKEEGKHIPHYVLVNMMGKFAVPLRSEGFDEIEYVFEDYKKDSL